MTTQISIDQALALRDKLKDNTPTNGQDATINSNDLALIIGCLDFLSAMERQLKETEGHALRMAVHALSYGSTIRSYNAQGMIEEFENSDHIQTETDGLMTLARETYNRYF